jgi:hypothetical protein
MYSVLWIRIRADRHRFGGSGSASRASRSGSESKFISTKCKDKLYDTVFQKILICCRKYSNDEDKTIQTGIAVNKSQQNFGYRDLSTYNLSLDSADPIPDLDRHQTMPIHTTAYIYSCLVMFSLKFTIYKKITSGDVLCH